MITLPAHTNECAGNFRQQINHQNLSTSDDPGNDGPGGTGVPYVDKFGAVLGYHILNHIAGGSGFTPQAQYNGNILN